MPVVEGKSTTPPEDKDEWRTPPELFSLLDKEFRFDLDAAATPENALCSWYFTKREDALSCDWNVNPPEDDALTQDEKSPNTTVFCNPPFSRVGDFLLKGREEAKKGVTSVFLVRADATETKWWRDGVLRYQEKVSWNTPNCVIRFLTPRIQFLDPGGTSKRGVKFPSAIIIMGPHYTPDIYWWNWKI